MKRNYLGISLLAALGLGACATSPREPLPGADPCPNCTLRRQTSYAEATYQLEIEIRNDGKLPPPTCMTALAVDIDAGGQTSSHNCPFSPSLCPGDRTICTIDHRGMYLPDPGTDVALRFTDTSGALRPNLKFHIEN